MSKWWIKTRENDGAPERIGEVDTSTSVVANEDEFQVKVRTGTELSEAVGYLLQQMGPLGPGFNFEYKPTNCFTKPAVIQFPRGYDWLKAAQDLAQGMGWLLECHDGTWRLVQDKRGLPNKVEARGVSDKQIPTDTVSETNRHDYLSTACGHGLHDKCRKRCKYCSSWCHCDCHANDPIDLGWMSISDIG